MPFPTLATFLRLAMILAFTVPVFAAELLPRSYSWLMAHSTLVALGEVESVSAGIFGDGRTATIRVDALIKGRLRKQFIDIAWSDKEYEEAAYKRDARVVVFAVMKKDSTYAQAAPGISCWSLEPVALKGKSVKGVEYSYPMDLLTGIPASALRETEVMEKNMNFQMAKRKQWIVADNLLPAAKPLVIPKPKPPKAKAKPASAPRGKVVKSRKPAAKSGKTLVLK